MEKHDYWQKLNKPPKSSDLTWNIPEQKFGNVAVIGGNSQNFSSVIRSAEYIAKNYPIKNLSVVLPESLRSKIPPLPGTVFCTATDIDVNIVELIRRVGAKHLHIM